VGRLLDLGRAGGAFESYELLEAATPRSFFRLSTSLEQMRISGNLGLEVGLAGGVLAVTAGLLSDTSANPPLLNVYSRECVDCTFELEVSSTTPLSCTQAHRTIGTAYCIFAACYRSRLAAFPLVGL
jgi:hypothetical protein